jgi:RsmE family RNA methyltransferase
MNEDAEIILLEQDEINDATVLLKGDRARHIIRVLRASPGDIVKTGIINGKLGNGTIIGMSSRQPYSVRLELEIAEEPKAAPLIDIMLALPRPIMLKRILSQATSLGVGHFFLVNANRVEKSFWDASLISPEACRKYLVEGLEQGVDTRLPTLSFHKGFKPFIETDLEEVKSRYRQMLVAHPGSSASLHSVHRATTGRTLLAIGPEGGWVDYEIERMHACGFAHFSMGPRILKVETAVTALHSAITTLNRV